MRYLITAIVFAAMTPLAGVAQSSAEYRAQGYGFVGPGGVSDGGATTLHFGVGGEGLVYKGLGVGGEIGYLAPARSLGDGFGVLSPNVSYHFLNASRSGKVVPFVTGGYSLLFRSGTANAVNFGGGVNWWFKQRLGLRLEVRDQVPAHSDLSHFINLRIGLSFR
jgi:hypothetical protein